MDDEYPSKRFRYFINHIIVQSYKLLYLIG